MKLKLLLGTLLLLGTTSWADELKLGSLAPDFTAVATDGSRVHLSAVLDHAPIILFFYPKDGAPEAVKEVCNLRDNFSAFHDYKATILGVSYDAMASHRNFTQEYHLPFLLLSDLSHDVAKSYGADGLFAAKLQTFVIDKQGSIIYINRFVNPGTQSLELQNVLAQL